MYAHPQSCSETKGQRDIERKRLLVGKTEKGQRKWRKEERDESEFSSVILFL